MRRKSFILLWLLIAAALLSACGGGKGSEPVETIGVRSAIDAIEENLGRKVCVKGFPVAFYLSYTYTGAKVYSVYISDSAEDYLGEIELPEEIRDDWIEVIVREKNPLWQSVLEIFEGKRETEEYSILLKGTKSTVAGLYYDFVELR